jgi:hypothetical protein
VIVRAGREGGEPGLGMALEKVAKNHHEFAGVLAMAVVACITNIIENDFSHTLRAAGASHQVLRETGRCRFGNMFVLGNSQNLGFGQAAECQAILESNHRSPPGF